MDKTMSDTTNKRLIVILTIAGTLLMIPLIAMQFTNEVNWSLFDFVLMGVLLFGTGLVCELVIRRVKTTRNRLILVSIALVTFFFIWAELAVGVFGTPFAGS